MATGPGGSQAGLCSEGPEGVGTLPATAEPPRGQPGGETEHVLKLYVHDYLKKGGFASSAAAFAEEAGLQSGAIAIDAPSGFLLEWWSVFWDVFIARTSDRASGTASSYVHAQAGKANDFQLTHQPLQPHNVSLLQQLQLHLQRQRTEFGGFGGAGGLASLLSPALGTSAAGATGSTVLGQQAGQIQAHNAFTLNLYDNHLRQQQQQQQQQVGAIPGCDAASGAGGAVVAGVGAAGALKGGGTVSAAALGQSAAAPSPISEGLFAPQLPASRPEGLAVGTSVVGLDGQTNLKPVVDAGAKDGLAGMHQLLGTAASGMMHQGNGLAYGGVPAVSLPIPPATSGLCSPPPSSRVVRVGSCRPICSVRRLPSSRRSNSRYSCSSSSHSNTRAGRRQSSFSSFWPTTICASSNC